MILESKNRFLAHYGDYSLRVIVDRSSDIVTGMGSPQPVGANMLPPAMPSPMPQLILASGQLVQGIQGAQLLIPTSQGNSRVSG